MRSRAAAPLAALVCLALVAAGCTGGGSTDEPAGPVTTRAPATAVDVIDVATPTRSAVGMSRRLFERSQVVVLSSPEPKVQELAARAAGRLGVPMLLPGPDVEEELERLGPTTVLGIGASDELPDLPDLTAVEPTRAAVDAAVADLPRSTADARNVVVLTRAPDANRAAVTTARAAGATVLRTPDADPRADADVVATLRERPKAAVIGVGRPFRHGLDYQVTAVRQELEQPGGGLLAFPGRHVVALYGHPGTSALGLLGEQGVAATVERAERVADRYRAQSKAPVVPALEIIATVASASKGKDGDYSAEADVADLLPLVRAAEKAGQYVVIDLQPGRSDFLSQAKRYRSLLVRPHVGLALDPEWRLTKGQKHLRQIGSVKAAEVNRVSSWLAKLTREQELPQKLFVLHQFSTSMITDRAKVVTTHPELSTVIHVDGQGSPAAKKSTWATIRRGAPAGVHWGWKNFHDEDEPMLTPRQTWNVRPRPDLVTYQ